MIYIKNLKIYAKVGFSSWEKVVKQQIIMDVKLSVNYTNDNFVNYKTIVNNIINFINIHHYDLLEDMAQEVKKFLEKEPNVIKCHIKIHKPLALFGLGAKIYII